MNVNFEYQRRQCDVPLLPRPQGTLILGIITHNPIWGMPQSISKVLSRSWTLMISQSRVGGLAIDENQPQKCEMGVETT